MTINFIDLFGGSGLLYNSEYEYSLTASPHYTIQEDEVRIRKLTPLECWRLQGFPDKSFEKARNAGISDTQLYKMAGNAVSVPVIEVLGEEVLENYEL